MKKDIKIIQIGIPCEDIVHFADVEVERIPDLISELDIAYKQNRRRVKPIYVDRQAYVVPTREPFKLKYIKVPACPLCGNLVSSDEVECSVCKIGLDWREE